MSRLRAFLATTTAMVALPRLGGVVVPVKPVDRVHTGRGEQWRRAKAEARAFDKRESENAESLTMDDFENAFVALGGQTGPELNTMRFPNRKES